MDNKTFYQSLDQELVPCELCGHCEFIEFPRKDRFNMGICTVMCKSCGFVMTNPRPTEAALEDFYKNHYRDFYFSYPDPAAEEYISSNNYKIAHARADWLVEFLTPVIHDLDNMQILDIGCGEGALLKSIRQRCSKAQLFGIEPDPTYARHAASVSDSKVEAISINHFLDQDTNCNEYDLISLSHVLEHLLEPQQKLRKLSQRLKPNGKLLIEVPNIASPYFGKGNIGAFHIGHVLQFTPETLEQLLHQCGFNVIQKFTGKNPVDPWAMTFLAQKTSQSTITRSVYNPDVSTLYEVLYQQYFIPKPKKKKSLRKRILKFLRLR